MRTLKLVTSQGVTVQWQPHYCRACPPVLPKMWHIKEHANGFVSVIGGDRDYASLCVNGTGATLLGYGTLTIGRDRIQGGSWDGWALNTTHWQFARWQRMQRSTFPDLRLDDRALFFCATSLELRDASQDDWPDEGIVQLRWIPPKSRARTLRRLLRAGGARLLSSPELLVSPQ